MGWRARVVAQHGIHSFTLPVSPHAKSFLISKEAVRAKGALFTPSAGRYALMPTTPSRTGASRHRCARKLTLK